MTRGYRILIVDDDADYVAAVGAYLEANGFTVVTAANGQEGLRMAARHRPALIIMDVMMGDRTEGLFAVNELRRLPGLERTPIIVASALYTTEPEFTVPPEAEWLAGATFLGKPVDLSVLLERINTLLDMG
ncbi:MAG: response regulator [Gemmatimonadota bacterium]|nr:response regulator [Gemmatimonadota bacterium]MDH3367739.1 response regulator [Gemmatimonadota bacterium]MDH3479293.1 response regulator [Gemmatimonadota bacterium]MDH3570921.1 response regulator [Gemmatimonadota bacterium]